MTPLKPIVSVDQAAVFSVPRRVVTIKRWSDIAFGALGLVMIAVFYPWHDPLPPDSIDHIVWPVLAVGIAAPMAFVWFRWKRIPRGAPGGTLHVGPDGVEYRVGPDRLSLDWEMIAAVYPITRPSQTQTRAVWLPREDPARPNSSRMTLLEIAHVKSPYCPVERPDGVLLPLTLFGTNNKKTEEIMDALHHHHAAARRQ